MKYLFCHSFGRKQVDALLRKWIRSDDQAREYLERWVKSLDPEDRKMLSCAIVYRLTDDQCSELEKLSSDLFLPWFYRTRLTIVGVYSKQKRRVVNNGT